MSGIKNSDACYFPDRLHPNMIRLLGSRTAETATSGPHSPVGFEWEGRQYVGGVFQELVKLETALAMGSFTEQWYKGYPAVTRQWTGKGQTWFIATYAEEAFYTDFITKLCREIGISPF